jgi:hypothetical protein
MLFNQSSIPGIQDPNIAWLHARILLVQGGLVKAQHDVRFGSKGDMCAVKGHVRFTPESGHVRCS